MIQLWAQNLWYAITGDVTPPPDPPSPTPDYWPKLDFTDYRNSMYSVGGF